MMTEPLFPNQMFPFDTKNQYIYTATLPFIIAAYFAVSKAIITCMYVSVYILY